MAKKKAQGVRGVAKKKAANVRGVRVQATKKGGAFRGGPAVPQLTDAEQDLVSNMEHGYQLETDSLGSNPVLRGLKEDEVIRPMSANRTTVKALEERGLITPVKGRDPLTIVWRLKSKAKQ